jgi:hypothetical protein
MAVFTLPAEMIDLYKKNIGDIAETAVNPDRRRMAIPDEAPRHYIDLDHYGDHAFYTLPHHWKHAVEMFTEDTLKAYGILPWHIYRMYFQLRDAFMVKDAERVLRISAELGHYVADAHVPLHTTENYNGQLTGQHGIHAFWESRLPELFSDDYDFFVGKAEYISDPQEAAWRAVKQSHAAVDSVLYEEKLLSQEKGDRKYAFESKGRQTMKVYSVSFSKAYHQRLRGMVERQMRASIKMIGDLWYTAWVDAGQPDLSAMMNYKPSEEELHRRREELRHWKQQQFKVREHEME